MFMKTRDTHLWQALFGAAFAFLPAFMSSASDTGTTAVGASTTQQVVVVPATPATPPVDQKLPYGVDDVLKLSRAQIGEEIILNYVRNSGTIYNLRASDIVYLKNAGVSEKVIGAMVDQRRQVEMAAAQTTQMTAQAPALTPVLNTAPTGPSGTYDNSASGTDMAAAAPAEAPLNPPASTVTTIPYPAATSAYYGYYYPYYPYYGYYPGVSVAFGFGPGCYYGHGYYGHGYYGHSYAVHGGGHVSHSGGGHH
jgi:hypothetical protein